MYRVEYTLPGQLHQSQMLERDTPLEAGQWLTLGSMFLVVERVIPGRRGDPYDALLICKPAVG